MKALAPYWPLLASLCGLLAWRIRKWSPPSGLFHTPFGIFVLTAVGGLLAALGPVLSSGNVTKGALVTAAAGALSSLAGAMDPKPVVAMLLPFVLAGSMLSGCTPGGKALANCELGQLPQILQSAIAKVAAIAAQPSGWEQDLEQLGIQVGPAQLSCVEQAIAAALAPTPASPDSQTKQMMRMHLQMHAAKHPRACRELRYGEVTLSRIRALVSGGNVTATDRAIFYAGHALVRW